MLLEELDHFRGEIAEMVDIERGLVQQTLEREGERVQREVKDLLAGSKGEIVNVLKLDVQKWLHGTHEGVVLMTESLKDDLNQLKADLSRTQVTVFLYSDLSRPHVVRFHPTFLVWMLEYLLSHEDLHVIIVSADRRHESLVIKLLFETLPKSS